MKEKRNKKSTIFRIFLLPLIAIMLVQGAITIGTLVVRRIAATLEEYSSSMMSRLVENRRVILQNDMNQRWASVRERETVMDQILEQFLAQEDAALAELLRSNELKDGLLALLFPECLEVLQNNSTTGIFLVLTGPEPGAAGEFDGFLIRDSDPNINPVNHTDLLLERGSKQLSQTWNVPLDTHWTSRFHLDSQDPAGHFFYAPWQAGADHPDADTGDLGYWSLPFSLDHDEYQMITYSIPLRHEDQVYGVLGVEISLRTLNEYFPAAELNQEQQSGYVLAVNRDSGYQPITGRGTLYDLVFDSGDAFSLRETAYTDLSLVESLQFDGQKLYAVACPLKLYSNNVPYEDTDWVLLGLDTEGDLFGLSRQLYIWMVAAVLIGLTFGVAGIYFAVRHLTKPVQHLMKCISAGRAGLRDFKPSNILEIDALYDVVQDLTEQQKEVENILLEEKERYRVALESSKDIFFSYDLQTEVLDIVNHNTMSGRWPCSKTICGFIDPQYIYEADRTQTETALRQDADTIHAEFRVRWPEETEFNWVALTGKALYDTDGRRWKLVGSIRNIQEQKEREAEQIRKNKLDGVTGLYGFSAGLERVQECRSTRPVGVMVDLCLDGLRETSEKNGIVFCDMVLEELGGLVRSWCAALAQETGSRVEAMRLNRDEIVLWLEDVSGARAEAFISELLAAVTKGFLEADFQIQLRAGLAIADRACITERAVRMARQAQFHAVSPGTQYRFYEDTAQALPPMQGLELHSIGYGEDVSLVSVALNLFGKGEDFSAQMMLMIRKIGRVYQADGVLVSLLRADFNSNYLEYQWHRDGSWEAECVRKYQEDEKEPFYRWLGTEGSRYFDQADCAQTVVRCFLGVASGQHGVALPMYDSGSYMGCICILGLERELLDIPEARQDLEELGQMIQAQLNQRQHDIASKAKSEFLSRMSHEIRTPMNGIIGMTAIALQPEQSPERVLDCLQKIQSSSDYLLGLINDILDMSKIESGKMKLEPVNFHMDEMLDTVEELIAPQAEAKGVVFTQDIQLIHHWFLADRMRISQVLINLLGNAVKFTPEQGAVALTVQEAEAPDGRPAMFFSVSDTGIGIAKEDQDRVFRSFEQAHDKNPAKLQGTGLGLSISSRLVQLMGSSILLESELGQGSTFSFTIPLTVGESGEAEVKQEELSFSGFRVLLVEDNELNAEIAQCLLEEREFQVDCVGDGAQAVERIRTTQPGTYDVILMDIMMPVMDGLEATRVIRSMERADCHTIPIIAMSANAFDDDLKKSVECGMNGHLSKPVEVDKLFRTLDAVIRNNKT